MIKINRYGNLFGSYPVLLVNYDKNSYATITIGVTPTSIKFHHIMKVINITGVRYELEDFDTNMIDTHIDDLNKLGFRAETGAVLL